LILAEPKAYPKNLGSFNTAGLSATQSVVTPSALTATPSDSNVKIWIYEPTTKVAIPSRGLFINGNGAGFTFQPSNPDGTFYAKWSQGSYLIDVVEPNPTDYIRKRYTATVDSTGKFSIQEMLPNTNGYFTLTLDLPVVLNPMLEEMKKKLLALASVPVFSFTPTSPCQLVDQVTPLRGIQVDLSAGFPKVPQRLPSFGRIKALIIPIDFSDVQGTDNTVNYFSPVANGVRDFYYAQSYGKVAFDFDIVSSWVRAPFTSTKFGTGGSVGAGDISGYLKALISHTDGAIDYSGYDAVYFLVPKEMPMANMGWGPAITSPNWISNGVILNGATGGADMYQVELNGIIGGRWKWMAHETGHAFGLYDEDLDHKSQSLGYWGIMAMSWSNQAIELGAWDRYLQGWLPPSQVNCTELNSLTAGGSLTKISPILRLCCNFKINSCSMKQDSNFDI
jgi:M6 family metalloprotease-like protein